MIDADTQRRAFAYLAAQAQREIAALCTVTKKYPDLVEAKHVAENMMTFQDRLDRPGWREANEELLRLARNALEEREGSH